MWMGVAIAARRLSMVVSIWEFEGHVVARFLEAAVVTIEASERYSMDRGLIR